MKYYVTIMEIIIKNVSILYYFSLRLDFIPLGFTDKVFNETVLTIWSFKGGYYK